MAEISVKSEIELARKESPVFFVEKLVEVRTKNDKTGLPEIPSAQLWYSMNESEKAEFREVVEKVTKWGDYEKDMLACHPKSVDKGAPIYRVRNR